MINLVSVDNKIYIEMYLLTFEQETPDLLPLPNFFVLYDKINKTITYDGIIFYKLENNYKLFKCKSFRYLENN